MIPQSPLRTKIVQGCFVLFLPKRYTEKGFTFAKLWTRELSFIIVLESLKKHQIGGFIRKGIKFHKKRLSGGVR